MIIPTRHFLLVGLLIAVPVSAWAIAYRPMNKAVHGVAEEIRSRTTNLAHFEEINEQYRELKSLTREVRRSTDDANSRIPSQHNAEQWLESASKQAQELGLIVKSVTTSGERNDGEYNVLPIDLNVIGTFESLYLFLQHLEKMERISRVDRMSLHRIEDELVDARIVIQLVFTSKESS